jgi:hypothetical protein
MTRVVFLLVALLATCSSLCAGSARAHGMHHEAPRAVAPIDLVAAPVIAHAPAAIVAVPRDGFAAIAADSHCPADDGLPCACGVDRCTNPQPPRIALAGTRAARVARPPARHRPLLAQHALVVARRSPPGSVGSRAPPASS